MHVHIAHYRRYQKKGEKQLHHADGNSEKSGHKIGAASGRRDWVPVGEAEADLADLFKFLRQENGLEGGDRVSS